MDEKLKSYLEDFKKYTIKMIEDLEQDNLDDFEELLDKRQQIIDEINDLNFNKNEFKEICEQLDIITLNDKLNERTKDEKDNLRQKILEIKKAQSANRSYNSGISNSVIFNKKV